jgi:hypothetical protein
MFIMGALLFSETNKKNTETILCSYTSGKVELIEKEVSSISNLDINSTLPKNSLLCTGEKSLCELRINNSILVRSGSESIIDSINQSSINVLSGSFLISVQDEIDFSIQSKSSLLKTRGKYTAIIDCTSNGGFKFIPLEGKGQIIPERGDSKDIYRGRLTMVLGSPSKLGNAYDIDLLLLLKSSRLINSFPTPLPSMKRISLSIYAQQLRLKGKFNALIGDAPTDDNLQMWAFGEEESK